MSAATRGRSRPPRIPKGAFTWTAPAVVRAAFETHQQRPFGWIEHARSLRLCADEVAKLWESDRRRVRETRTSRDVPHLRSGPIFLMLAGLAVEGRHQVPPLLYSEACRPEVV